MNDIWLEERAVKMNHFIRQYLLQIVNASIPFGIGTLILMYSYITKKKSKRLFKYGFTIGIALSIFSSILIIEGIFGILSNLF